MAEHTLPPHLRKALRDGLKIPAHPSMNTARRLMNSAAGATRYYVKSAGGVVG